MFIWPTALACLRRPYSCMSDQWPEPVTFPINRLLSWSTSKVRVSTARLMMASSVYCDFIDSIHFSGDSELINPDINASFGCAVGALNWFIPAMIFQENATRSIAFSSDQEDRIRWSAYVQLLPRISMGPQSNYVSNSELGVYPRLFCLYWQFLVQLASIYDEYELENCHVWSGNTEHD